MTCIFLVLLAFYCINAISISRNCEEDGLHYQCLDESKKCIPITWLCDGRSDCLNGDDEHGQVCEPRGSKAKVFERGSCLPRQFECEDLSGKKKCILEEWRCDRHVDCRNGLDEEDCDYSKKPETQIQTLNMFDLSKKLTCQDGQFLCKIIKECLSSRSMVCNGRKDCLDGTDELDCNESSNQTTTQKQSSGSIMSNKSSGTTNPSTDRTSQIREGTNKANLIRLIRGSSTEMLPISPKHVDPVSATANKPQQVSMNRIRGNTAYTTIPTLTQGRPSTFVSTSLRPVVFVKREMIADGRILHNFNLFLNQRPIVPRNSN